MDIFYSVTQVTQLGLQEVTSDCFMNETMNHSFNRFVLIESGMKQAAVFMSEFLNHSFNRFAQKDSLETTKVAAVVSEVFNHSLKIILDVNNKKIGNAFSIPID